MNKIPRKTPAPDDTEPDEEDLKLIKDKKQVIEALQKSLTGQWLATKKAREHFLVVQEKFNIKRDHKGYKTFMLNFTRIKQSHVQSMARVCSYLTFNEVLILSKVNRRLYYVTGDVPMLTLHTRVNQDQVVLVPQHQTGYVYAVEQ